MPTAGSSLAPIHAVAAVVDYGCAWAAAGRDGSHGGGGGSGGMRAQKVDKGHCLKSTVLDTVQPVSTITDFKLVASMHVR